MAHDHEVKYISNLLSDLALFLIHTCTSSDGQDTDKRQNHSWYIKKQNSLLHTAV